MSGSGLRGVSLLGAIVSLFLLSPTGAFAQPQGPVTLEGDLHFIHVDDFENPENSYFRYVLDTDEGIPVDLNIPEDVMKGAGGVHAVNRKRVRVFIQPPNQPLTEGETSGETVSGIELVSGSSSGGGGSSGSKAISGPQPFATLACKFKDYKKVPQDISYLDGMMGSQFPGMDHYWQENSYGIINMTGSGQFGWYSLPGRSTDYCTGPGQCDIYQMLDDCVAAADPDVFFPDYVGINLVFNGPQPGALGGSRTLFLDGVVQHYGVAWYAESSWQKANVMAHEIGHTFGLPHSSGPYGNVYDSSWDVMSSGAFPSGTEFGYAGKPTISNYKDILGWIDPLQKHVARANRTDTIEIERLTQPTDGGTAFRMAEIQAGVTNTYTLEARRTAGYDQNLAGEGVIIHDVHSGQAWVVDPDGNGSVNDDGAIWVPGETFTDAANGISVTVDSDTGTGYIVSISRGSAVDLPDLVATNISGPSIAGPGSSVRLDLTIENQGPGSSEITTLAGIYLSTDATIDGSDFLHSWYGIPPLAPGGSFNGSVSITLPGTGDFYYGVIADGDGRVNETNENNNAGLGNLVQVDYYPPVVTTNSATNISGTQATLEATVNPAGLDTDVWFEWGTTTSYGNTTPVQAIGNGNTDVLVQEVLTGLSAGVTYHFRAVGQSAGGTTYGSDSNFVPGDTGTDFIPTDIAPDPTSADMGTPINVTATVLNQGNVDDLSGQRVELHLADDPNLTGWSVELDRRPIDVLLAGQSATVDFSGIIPTGINAGAYYLVVFADGGDWVIETNENNNLHAEPITITSPFKSSAINVETGIYVESGKGRDRTITFLPTTSFTAGDGVVFRVQVVDDLGQPLSSATVDLAISGPENATITTGFSDFNGIAEGTWQTSAPDKKGQGGTAAGSYSGSVSGVNLSGYEWDGVSPPAGNFTIN